MTTTTTKLKEQEFPLTSREIDSSVSQCLKISRIQQTKRVDKSFILKIPKIIQTVIPDGSFSIGQKLVENAKVDKFKGDIGDLQLILNLFFSWA